MSGTPSEAEVRAQWTAAVGLLERTRNFADGTLGGAGQTYDTLIQALEGEYTPGLVGEISRHRQAVSGLLAPSYAAGIFEPLLLEFMPLIGYGGNYTDPQAMMRALYEHMHSNTQTVESRNITYDTSATAGGSNVGNGVMSRLTVDAEGYNLEACTVETKIFRCRRDQNSGTAKHAEEFEVVGEAASQDNLLIANFGSGLSQRIISKHAGTGAGGSLLRNSSFSRYNSTSTPKFDGWTQTAGGASIDQDTTNYYRSFPNATTDASLRITGGAGTVTLTQYLTDNVRQLDPLQPYFFRVMLNKTVGTAVGGTVTIRMGSQSANVTIAALGANWQELLIAVGTGCWYENFNQDNLKVEIEWASSTSGTLLVDDVIFAPWDLIDGTYWCLRHNATSPVAWLRDDTLSFTDTGGAPATAKIQYWLWRAGLGYLPSTTGTPTFTEPS